MSLRRQYSVCSRSETRDSLGVRAQSYAHKFYIWGEEPRDGSTSTFRDVGNLRSEETLRLRTRYTASINVGDQLVASDHTLYIRSAVDLDGRRRWLQLVASRSPAEGT